MSAVLRLWWTFYTAFPLQRWLAVSGLLSGGGLMVVGAFASGDAPFFVLGGIFLVVLAVFPAVFAGGALLRALSAPRNHQLWPHFRSRMLVAVALFVTTLALLPAALSVANARTLPVAALVYPFAFVTAIYLSAFLFSGDWRFGFLGPVLLLAVVVFLRGSFGPAAAIAASASQLVGLAALLAWVAFFAWYVRVRRVKPWMLTAPPGAGWETPSNRPVTRETALHALLTGRMQAQFVRQLLTTAAVAAALGSLLLLLSGSRNLLPPATSFVWAFVSMTIAGARTVPIAHQSRLLWLRVDGRRDDIRVQIERVAWRYWLLTFAGIGVFAVLPPALRGASFQDLAFGLAACASAVVYGGYVALAAPTGVKMQLAGFGLMTVAQLALLARADPAVTSVVIVITAQILGAALFRALAVRRWRRIDWLQLQPLTALSRGLHGLARP